MALSELLVLLLPPPPAKCWGYRCAGDTDVRLQTHLNIRHRRWSPGPLAWPASTLPNDRHPYSPLSSTVRLLCLCKDTRACLRELGRGTVDMYRGSESSSSLTDPYQIPIANTLTWEESMQRRRTSLLSPSKPPLQREPSEHVLCLQRHGGLR